MFDSGKEQSLSNAMNPPLLELFKDSSLPKPKKPISGSIILNDKRKISFSWGETGLVYKGENLSYDDCREIESKMPKYLIQLHDAFWSKYAELAGKI